jgi:hypothetical protein
VTQNDDSSKKPVKAEAETTEVQEDYQPPKLTLIGNMRDLLGKSGPRADVHPMPNPSRP